MSEKSIKLSNKNEAWQLRLHRGDKGCFAILENTSEEMSVTTRLSRVAFGFYENTISTIAGNISCPSHEEIVKETKALLEDEPFIVGITGRSGSGKSTLARRVEAKYKSDGFDVTVVSTDDYNRGKKEVLKLLGIDHEKDELINWDTHAVYDMNTLYWDLRRAKWWMPTPGVRRFDFSASEVEISSGFLEPASVMIVEGIMANSPVLRDVIDKHYLVDTPLATCIGRRVMRDTNIRQTSWNAQEILRYQLEIAEPEFIKRLK